MKTKIALIAMFILGIHSSYAQTATQTASSFAVKQPTDLFIGQIMKASSLNKDAYEFPNAKYNPITIMTSSPFYFEESLPSNSNMMTFLREKVISSGRIKQNQAFSYISRELSSYNELSLFFGQKMNLTQLFGVTTNQKKKTLAIIDISQSYFSVSMDFPYPDNGEAKTPDELQKLLCSNSKDLGDMNDLIYVTNIQFGRKITILVDSPYSYGDVKEAMQNIMDNTGVDESKITDKSRAIIANSTIRTIILNNDTVEEMNPENPFASIVNYFKRPVNKDDFGKPISFSASYLKDNSVFHNKYSLE